MLRICVSFLHKMSLKVICLMNVRKHYGGSEIRYCDEDVVRMFLPYMNNKISYEITKCCAEMGNEELVDYIMEEGVGKWYVGLKYAEQAGHSELVRLFEEIGNRDWNDGMKQSAHDGYLDLVRFFEEKGANNWHEAAHYAASGGHLNIINYFLGRRRFHSLDTIMRSALDARRMDAVRFLLSKGAYREDWRVSNAIRSGDIPFARELLSLGFVCQNANALMESYAKAWNL